MQQKRPRYSDLSLRLRAITHLSRSVITTEETDLLNRLQGQRLVADFVEQHLRVFDRPQIAVRARVGPDLDPFRR